MPHWAISLLLLAAAERPAAREVPSPAAAGAFAPHLAAGRDGRAWMSWLEKRPAAAGEAPRHALRFAAWEGSAWGEAATLREGPGFFANWADFPSLVELADGTLAAHWLEKVAGGTYAYHVRLAFSRDRGRSFSEPITLHDDQSAREHGFVTLVPLAGGGLAAVWLDGREMNDDPEAKDSGDMTLRFARLDARGALVERRLLDPRVCECCGTSAVETSGRLAVFYRNRSDSEVRDLQTLRVPLGPDAPELAAPALLHADGWQIAGCPVNGPAADASGDRVAVAWFSEAGGQPRVQVAFSRDAGATYSAPVAIAGPGARGRVDLVLLEDGSALVSWLEVEAGSDRARVRARRAAEGRKPAPPFTLATTTSRRASGFPRLLRAGRQVLLAWTEDAEPSRVRTALLPVTP